MRKIGVLTTETWDFDNLDSTISFKFLGIILTRAWARTPASTRSSSWLPLALFPLLLLVTPLPLLLEILRLSSQQPAA